MTRSEELTNEQVIQTQGRDSKEKREGHHLVKVSEQKCHIEIKR